MEFFLFIEFFPPALRPFFFAHFFFSLLFSLSLNPNLSFSLRYVNLNYLGFHKILKKHDKNLPHAPCQQFYVAHLHHQ